MNIGPIQSIQDIIRKDAGIEINVQIAFGT